ncbi:MAG: class I SAM-dependent methyltransferase [Erythrobacter sp.]|nr:class I SAM-dependent methyltransferase [Erythrobacter sp.]
MPYNLAIPGWMPEAELQVLERLARTIPAGGAMLEVGPFAGRSSWCWSKSVAPGVRVTCVDIWNPREHPFSPPASRGEEAVKPDFGYLDAGAPGWGTQELFAWYTRDCDNITALRGRSPDDFRAWPADSLDLVFLDGVHHNPVFNADLRHWYRRVKPGGILCGDDCARSHPDVLWTVHDFCKQEGIPFSVERRIWMLQRPLSGDGQPRTPLMASYALSGFS